MNSRKTATQLQGEIEALRTRVAELERSEQRLKQVEEELRVREELLSNILSNIPHAVFWKDRRSVYLGCNENFVRHAGLNSASEIIGKTDHDLPWRAKEADFYRECDREVMETKIPRLNIEESQHRANGKQATVLTSKVPLRDSKGNVIGILGIYADITERKRAQEVLRQSEEKFRALAETAAATICISQGADLVFANPAAERLTGYSREELCRMSFWDIIHPDSQSQVKERGLARERGEDVPSPYEARIVTKEGNERYVEISASRFLYEGRSAVLATGFDITDRRRAQTEMRTLARLATRLAAISTVDAMLHILQEESEQLLGWDAHYLALRRPGDSAFHVVSLIDTVQGEKRNFTPTRWQDSQLYPETQPILKGKPVLINRKPGQHEPTLDLFGDRSRPSASLMFAPVRSGEQVIGDLSVQSYKPGRYTEADLQTLQRVADTLAPALERAFSDEARRKSEERLKAQYRGIPVPTYTWQKRGEDFVLVDYNDAARTITKGGIVDFVGTKATELYPDSPEILAEMRRCLTARKPITRDMYYRLRTTGENKFLSVSYAFAPPDLVLVHTQDLTDRRRAEEALQESERKYRILFEEAKDAIYVTTREGKVLEVNRAMVDLLGYSREELLEMNVRQTYASPGDRRGFQQEVEREGFVRDYELRLRRKDGSIINCLLSSRVRRDGDGTPLGYHGVLRDVTRKKQAEDERQRLDQLRREFIANASHEFKTPLTAIQGFAETLLAGALENPENSKYFLEIIHDNALRLEQLTNDLGKISLMDEGRLTLDRVAVEVPDFVSSCVETSRPKAEHRQITLRVDYAEPLPPVRGDGGRLREVLQNLLDNAVQYTPPGGEITVQAALAPNRQVKVSVSDTGIGIPKDRQSRIFERFYRVDSGRSRKVGGTGLGLAIVKNLVEAHGGHIELESEPGRGSTFTVFLPRYEEEIQAKAKPGRTVARPRKRDAVSKKTPSPTGKPAG